MTQAQTHPVHEVRETLRSVALPGPPIIIRPLTVAPYNKGAYDEALDQLQRPDRYSVPAAWNAFGDDADGPAIPRVPGPRQPSDYAGAA